MQGMRWNAASPFLVDIQMTFLLHEITRVHSLDEMQCQLEQFNHGH